MQAEGDALLTAIAKARAWIDDIRLGRLASFSEIAERESQGERHIRLSRQTGAAANPLQQTSGKSDRPLLSRAAMNTALGFINKWL
jgi:hypothetical protein